MRNLRLDICYDGSRYKGWQRLPGTDNTIQQKLETTLSRILAEEVEVTGSGRTDAGTHAKGQVANVHCTSTMSCEEILMQLRRYLPEDIGIYSCRNVSPRFHARLNAKKKTYLYRLWNSSQPCVFDRKYVYQDVSVLDIQAMQLAAAYFVGTHDFSAFCANKNMKKSTLRCIESFQILEVGNEIRFQVTGNGFLHHMVRIMVGTLLEVGTGTRSAESIPELFGAQRAQAGPLVPACGLCLMEVVY
ncbi:MAG: tRNA pseudouridine(38-40) synthase TruA [Oscillospiraceae bacterium]|nr:tRNA pseudouridine(38-40) synthase TruA [Oscillospiraceae bacterium]